MSELRLRRIVRSAGRGSFGIGRGSLPARLDGAVGPVNTIREIQRKKIEAYLGRFPSMVEGLFPKPGGGRFVDRESHP